MSVLRVSSIPNEFYLGDMPGTLQYDKDVAEIVDCGSPLDPVDDFHCGYVLCELTQELVSAVLPNTATTQDRDWKVVLLMKRELPNGDVWLKAALQDRTSGKFALLTSTNNKKNLTRPIHTMSDHWWIGHYRMSAPMVFWTELANRIKYSL